LDNEETVGQNGYFDHPGGAGEDGEVQHQQENVLL